MNFEKIKDRIAFKLVNRKKTVYKLEEIPHTDYLDLAYVYYVVLYMDEGGVDTVIVKNEYLDEWGISDKELFEIARQNFSTLFKMQLFGVMSPEQMIMVTTKYKMFGAVYMTETGLTESLADLYDDDICIIPSSIHEIIMLPAGNILKENVDEIIRSVNKEAVNEDEYLSDHMYLYSRKEGKVIC